ncbi:hypothetical protein LTR66_009853 [Elasticomyces elasticus]|nr:hypothetical protein LTR66_009853 [Elasticomyces elasticus]
MGMDPFSDEILGVKIQVAALMEKIQNFPKAIEVLEIVRGDCLQWVDELGGLITAWSGRGVTGLTTLPSEQNRGKRTRVLGKTVAISVKLADLYANNFVRDKDSAEERLVWAVETVLKEKKRREDEGVTEDEGDWISDSEMGASLEALAHHYEEKNQHYLATPLFLQALSLYPTNTCHSVVLMNNLATSLAQQLSPPTAGTPPPSRSSLVDNAQEWAQKALDVAAQIKPPTRDEECDIGCAVATHNLGEFAEMNGQISEARKRYAEAVSIAKAIGFSEGVENGRQGLKRIAQVG